MACEGGDLHLIATSTTPFVWVEPPPTIGRSFVKRLMKNLMAGHYLLQSENLDL